MRSKRVSGSGQAVPRSMPPTVCPDGGDISQHPQPTSMRMQVVPSTNPAARIDGWLVCGKDVLPFPFIGCVGVFAHQRQRQLHAPVSLLHLQLVLLVHVLQVFFERLGRCTRQHCEAVSPGLCIMDANLQLSKIEIFNPESQALHHSHTAAAERLRFLENLPLIDTSPDVDRLADLLLARHVLPEKAAADAQHVAMATIGEVDYLLTWNCRHIANADRLPSIYRTLRDEGHNPPLIVTPEEFSNDE